MEARSLSEKARNSEIQDLTIGRIRWHQKTRWTLRSLLKRQSTHGRAGCGNLASPIRREGPPEDEIAEPGPSTRWSLRVAGGCAAFPVHEPVT